MFAKKLVTETLARCREVATGAGWSRRIAVTCGTAGGAAMFVVRLHQGNGLGAAALSGLAWTAFLVPFAVLAIAQNQVMWRMAGEPAAPRSMEASLANVGRMQAITWIFALLSLALSALTLLR